MVNDFDSADPSSMQAQGACDIWTQLNDLALHEFSFHVDQFTFLVIIVAIICKTSIQNS